MTISRWSRCAAHATAAAERSRLRTQNGATPAALTAHTQLVIGLLLLILWSGSRDRLELLWFGCFLMFLSASNYSMIRLLYTGGTPTIELWGLPIAYVFLNCCCHVVLLERPIPRWRIGTIAAAILTSRAITGISLYMAVSMALPVWWSLGKLAKGRRDGQYFAGAILVYAVLMINAMAIGVVPGWPIPATAYLGPFQIISASTTSAGVAFVIMLVLLRMVAADRREKYRLAAEFEAARGVQQLLLQRGNENREYPLDAAYLPAAEVGGDFYQRLDDGEGGFTVVVGDVSGKGLKAAMVVSMVVGLLRRDRRLRPGAMLASLNESLNGGMDGGFVTCGCAHIGADGRIRLANAGHLPPYLGGREVPVAAGLPLGVVEGVDYAETEVVLVPGEQLTLVSDGVVEAANAKGELFGFERTREISGRSAQEIAAAARMWGQNDDITVVTVRRAG